MGRAALGVSIVALTIVIALSGCGGDEGDSQEPGVVETRLAGAAGEGSECAPTVMVVRHAEDVANPAGGADILGPDGIAHAKLYPKLFRDYLAEPHKVGPDGTEVPICPIGKVIAINPERNPQNLGPGTNPYQTIRPLAEALALPGGIQVTDPEGVSYSTVYDWDDAERLGTLLANGSATPTSTVVAWDKQGMNPSENDLNVKTIYSESGTKKLGSYGFTPMLRALPENPGAIAPGPEYTPQRTDFYVFSQQQPASSKFAFAKSYQQCFSNDGGNTWSVSPTADSSDIKLKSGRFSC